jgi:predicted DNA-binding transcriptional regulator YafY
MILNKWQLEALVKNKPGLSLKEFATELGVDPRTAIRHARRHNAIVVELGRRGKGCKTRLWWKYRLPAHLSNKPTKTSTPAEFGELQYVSLDDL